MVQLQENSTTSLGVSYTVYNLELLPNIDDVQNCLQSAAKKSFSCQHSFVPQFVVILAGFLHNCMLYMAMCVQVTWRLLPKYIM